MNAGYQKLRSRVLVAVLSLLMVFGNVATPLSGAFSVYAATPVNSWEALKAAVAEGGEITVSGDIVAEGESLEISKDVTLKGEGAVNILRKKADSYDSLFKVVSGGSLTLGDGITLSGKTAECEGAEAATYDDIEEVTKAAENEDISADEESSDTTGSED